jgi:nitrate/nitrite transport system ATP-binding protein
MEIQQKLNNTVIMITHDVDEAVLLSDRIVMMTNGPAATIGEILDVNLPHPRNRLALAEDVEYNRLRSAVLTFLYEKQRKVEVIPTAESTKKTEKAEVKQNTSSVA